MLRLQREAVEAELDAAVVAGAIGSARQFDLYWRESSYESGAHWNAQPWMYDGEMNLSNTEVLINFAREFGCEVPLGALPLDKCGCEGYTAPPAPALFDTDERWLCGLDGQQAMLDHQEETCALAGEMRTLTHNNLQRIWFAMLTSIGIKPRWECLEWDANAGPDADHRRPDIVFEHPETGVQHVLDVTI